MFVLQLVCRGPICETRGEIIADGNESIISFFGTVAISASLAEIASIYPTAGGMSTLDDSSRLIESQLVQGIEC